MGRALDWKPPVLGSFVSLSPLTSGVSWASSKTSGHFPYVKGMITPETEGRIK